MSWLKEKNGMSEIPEPAGICVNVLGNIVLETHIHDMMEGFLRPDPRGNYCRRCGVSKGPDTDSR